MSLPEWISKDVVENALRKYFQCKTIEIVGMVSKQAVPAGDNYCSEMYRICVKYTSTKNGNVETISLITKCKPESGMGQLITSETPVFEKEIEMYNTTIPDLNKLLGGNANLSADCLQTEIGKHGWLILQDLAPLGYKMADRKKGFDMDHCKLILTKIAKLHASSAVLHEKEPHSMDTYFSGIFTNKGDSETFKHFCIAAYQSLILALKKWAGYETYTDKLSKLCEQIYEKTVKAAERRPGFNVLNHGDLWVNNMLFKYDSNGKPCDVMFVDFQFSVFTSPSIDLIYFIHTSVSNEVGEKCVDSLLEFYHCELVKNLNKMNYPKNKIPSFGELQKDYNDRAFLGLSAAVTVLPIAKAPSREDANLEEIFNVNDSEDGFRQTSYNTTEYKSRMQFILKHFNKTGLIK